jgi:hypothetical protein
MQPLSALRLVMPDARKWHGCHSAAAMYVTDRPRWRRAGGGCAYRTGPRSRTGCPLPEHLLKGFSPVERRPAMLAFDGRQRAAALGCRYTATTMASYLASNASAVNKRKGSVKAWDTSKRSNGSLW